MIGTNASLREPGKNERIYRHSCQHRAGDDGGGRRSTKEVVRGGCVGSEHHHVGLLPPQSSTLTPSSCIRSTQEARNVTDAHVLSTRDPHDQMLVAWRGFETDESRLCTSTLLCDCGGVYTVRHWWGERRL